MRWRSSRIRRRARRGSLVASVRLARLDVRVFDPVAGGEALLVLEMGDEVSALAVFTDPATGAPRLACASGKKVLVFDPVAGGDALLVLDIGSEVKALAVFKEPATGAPRLACGSQTQMGRCASSTRFLAATRCSCSTLGFCVTALVAFKDLATGALRLACGGRRDPRCDVHVFDPVAGGEALVVLEGHTDLV